MYSYKDLTYLTLVCHSVMWTSTKHKYKRNNKTRTHRKLVFIFARTGLHI